MPKSAAKVGDAGCRPQPQPRGLQPKSRPSPARPQMKWVQRECQPSTAGPRSKWLPTACLILSPNRAPEPDPWSRPKWQEAWAGERGALSHALASWRSPLAALHRGRAAPSAEPPGVPLVDGGLVVGFNGGIIFTLQTPREVS